MSEIELTIDEKKVVGREGQTILDVAKENGIHIPTLCYHEKLPKIGACRICCVDVGRPDKLEAACALPISKGMVVQTKSERVIKARRMNLELLLSNHQIDVRACEKNGRNVLQELTYELGINLERLRFADPNKRTLAKPVDDSNPVIIRDPNKCILCVRCISACNDVRHYGILNFEKRGFDINIISGVVQPLLESGCVSCGECATVCPTGAITALARDLVQGEIDNVISTGMSFSISRSVNVQRSRLGLSVLEEVDITDLIKIARKTNLKSRLTK